VYQTGSAEDINVTKEQYFNFQQRVKIKMDVDD